jgi:hypothetical protein
MFGMKVDQKFINSLPFTVTNLIFIGCTNYDFTGCPVCPYITTLVWSQQSGSLDFIPLKFPALVTLRITAPVANLESLRGCSHLRFLSVTSDNLIDLGPLASIRGLQKLNVSKCPKVVDFSSVRHVPIIHK